MTPAFTSDFVHNQAILSNSQRADCDNSGSCWKCTFNRQFLEQQGKNAKFDFLYARVTEESKEFTCEPVLSSFKRMPRQYNEGFLPPHRFEDSMSFFRQQYFEVLDIACRELERRFLQRRCMPVATSLESIPIKARNGHWNVVDLPSEIILYSKEISMAKNSAANAP